MQSFCAAHDASEHAAIRVPVEPTFLFAVAAAFGVANIATFLFSFWTAQHVTYGATILQSQFAAVGESINAAQYATFKRALDAAVRISVDSAECRS